MVVLALGVAIDAALATQRQGVVLDADVHVLGVDAGQLSLEHDVAILLVDVDDGRPGSAESPVLVHVTGTAERLAEETVHAVLDRDQVTERFETNDRHGSSSPPINHCLTVYSASTTSLSCDAAGLPAAAGSSGVAFL